ncbi:MAG TPA: hypothetical protein VGH83_05390 [Candidatus Acidoferrum sp.]|jgi:hypothetical protein
MALPVADTMGQEEIVKKPGYKIAAVIFVTALLVCLKAYAATPKKPAQQVVWPSCVATIPKSWGAFRGGSTQAGLAFEDSAGTLRFVTNVPCDGAPVVALEIRRTAGQ